MLGQAPHVERGLREADVGIPHRGAGELIDLLQANLQLILAGTLAGQRGDR